MQLKPNLYEYNASEYAYMTLEQRLLWRQANLPYMTQTQVWEFYRNVLQPMEKQLGEDTLLEELEMDMAQLDEQINAMAKCYYNGLIRGQKTKYIRDKEEELFLKSYGGKYVTQSDFSD